MDDNIDTVIKADQRVRRSVSEANLASADISTTALRGAALRNAYLRDANLDGTHFTAK